MDNKRVITIDYILDIMNKYYKYIFSILLLAVFLSIIYCIVTTPLYKSTVSMYPSYKKNNMSNAMGGVLGLANNMGFNIFDTKDNNFDFQDILNSKKLKKSIILNDWNTNNGKNNLVKYWKVEKDGLFTKLKKSFGLLKDNDDNYYNDISIDIFNSRLKVVKQESGLIFVTVYMEEKQLSADIVNYIASWIDMYISKEMNVQATKNREFIEQRLESAKAELFISEEKYSAFLKQHSIASDDPETLLEKARLLRNIEVNQEVYVTLKQQYELNKIEELKERPVLNILDNGEPASTSSHPKVWVILISFIFTSIFLSLVFFLLYESLFVKSNNNK